VEIRLIKLEWRPEKCSNDLQERKKFSTFG